ncbi:PQQ-binding-like beta-propeller repeat protein [Haloarchaeobius sp. HME9146]|uniref:outer membrane protein assembly factor BamB family protein n=1 Tax=Haloarchaeobius sp. HME9146 TaxID=2978732 RepID=UPI0021C203C2|nr:PQQ-binding-like beta-propeller repeat protein [Haloarchaeobius sp. HME9146]MCT9095741.1 PQQ-binding-like beta-propeller repeat protein [Haloarchaeobius sp. HME9146]
MSGPLQSLSRREVLLFGSAALVGGQAIRPSLFKSGFDTGPSVSLDEWHLPGRSPSRQNYAAVAGGDDLSVTWEVPFEQETGYSLAVADGTVFVPTWNSALHALDTTDGRQRWQFAPDAALSTGIAVAAGHVCCPTDRDFYVLGSDGARSWWLPGVDDRSLYWLLDPTYLPVGNVLFLNGDDGLEARDIESGLTHWQTTRHVGPVAYGDGKLICSAGYYESVRHSAHDPSDGSRLWRTPEYEYRHRGSAIAPDTLVAYGGSDDTGRIQTFDPNDGRLQWESTVGTTLVDVALTVGLVVATGTFGQLHAFDPDTGERLWTRTDLGRVGGTVRTEQRLYVHEADGVSVLDPETGETRDSLALDGGEPRSLALAGGRLLALTESGLYALEVRDDA